MRLWRLLRGRYLCLGGKASLAEDYDKITQESCLMSIQHFLYRLRL
jgi:hypothetical protein